MPRGRKKKIRIQCFLPYNIIKLEREDRCYYHPTGIDGVKKKKKKCSTKLFQLITLYASISHTFYVPSMLMGTNVPKVDMCCNNRCYPGKEVLTAW